MTTPFAWGRRGSLGIWGIWGLWAAVVLVTLAPDVAHACPTCFSANDANRVAYLITFIIMTVLPLGFVGGVVYWIFRRYQALEQLEQEALVEVGPSELGPHGNS